MGLNLRAAILNNVAGSNEQQIEATIVDAVQSGEEKMLPGLGVLFEVYWNQASDQQKNEVISQITNGIQR